jgi:Mg2+-importing ATPase
MHAGVVEGRRTFGNILKYIMMGTSSNFGNMLSMAAASVFLPFIPMLPGQILLNNVLYDLSEVPIPLDAVDEQDLLRPRQLDMRFIGRFMWYFGALSSVFDGLTFLALIFVVHADAALFRTGWFVESLLTQVLVIFVIRTRARPWASRPSRTLTLTSLAVALAAALLPLSPLAGWFHFARPPLELYALIGVLLMSYLALVEVLKRRFFRRFADGT